MIPRTETQIKKNINTKKKKLEGLAAAVPIPAVASASVLHSAAVSGSVVGVVRPL